jgi:UMF1 family MFS transporter
MYFAITIFAVFLHYTWQFWVLACTVGMCQGGIQALSRSYFGKLVPKEHSNEYFGFFDIFGKYSSVMGASIIGVFSQFNLGYIGVGSISLLFVAGLILLLRVPHSAADNGGVSA